MRSQGRRGGSSSKGRTPKRAMALATLTDEAGRSSTAPSESLTTNASSSAVTTSPSTNGAAFGSLDGVGTHTGVPAAAIESSSQGRDACWGEIKCESAVSFLLR